MGKRQKRFIAKLMIVLMVVSLLPTKFMGGGVTVKAATTTWIYERDKTENNVVASITDSEGNNITGESTYDKSKKGTFAEEVCWDGTKTTNAIASRTGLLIATTNKDVRNIVLKNAGRYNFYFMRTDSSNVSVNIGKGGNEVSNNTVYGNGNADTPAVTYIAATDNEEITMTFPSKNVVLMAIQYTPGYTVSGTIDGLDDLTGLELKAVPVSSDEAVEVTVDTTKKTFSFFGETGVEYKITASGVTGKTIADGASIVVAGQITDAVIKFEEAKKYTVTLAKAENGSAKFVDEAAGEENGSVEVYEGTTVTVKAEPTDANTYRFASWSVEGIDGELTDAEKKAAELKVVVKNNITLTPSFELIPQKYTLTINSDHGKVTANANGADVLSDGSVSGGDTVKLSAEAADGYIFYEWTVEGVEITDADALKNPELEFEMPEKAVTVTAVYAAKETKTLTYNNIDATFFTVPSGGLSKGNGCKDYTNGYKGDSNFAITFTVPENRYAKVTIYALGNSNNNADFSIKKGDTVVGTVAVSKAQSSSIPPQVLAFAGILDAGEYTLVGNGGKQGILYQLDVDLYEQKSTVPEDPSLVTVSGVITSAVDLNGGNITIANDTYGSFAGTITTTDGEISYVIENVKGDGAEYSLLSLSSTKLNEAKSLIKENKFGSVTVNSENVTADFEITYDEITNEWDFTKNFEAPVNKLEKSAGTYKGLSVDATNNGKFAVNSGYVQINKDTIVTIPVPEDKAGTVTITLKSGDSGQFTLTAGENTADQTTGKVSFVKGTQEVTLAITANANVTKITIETSDEYTITVADDIENGAISVDKSSAAEGDTVTVTAEPSKCYKLDSITVNGETITGTTFTMPAEDATVSATFVEAHTTSEIKEVPATCIAVGKQAYYKCNGCNKYFEDAEGTKEIADIDTWGVTEKAAHTYAEDFTTDKAATATEAGSKSKHCTTLGCDAKTDVTEIPALGENHTHTLTKTDAVAATCIKEGKNAYYKCEDCGAYFEDEKAAKEIENIKTWGVIGKADHTYAEDFTVDKEATATEAGSKSRHCTTDGCDAKTDVTEIPATGVQEHTHTMTKTEAVAATCIAVGKQAYYKCNGCNKYFEDAEGTKEIADIDTWGVTEKAAHNFAAEYTVDTEATATEAGSKSRHCTTPGCDAKTDVTEIPALGENHTHTLTKTEAVPATCIAVGKQAYYKCEGCSKYFEDAEGTKVIADINTWGVTEKVAHNFAAEYTVDKAATATEAGSKSRHCTTPGCDAKTDVTEIPATGTQEQPTQPEQSGLRYEEDLEIFKYYENDEWVEDKYGYVEFDGATFLVANGVAATEANGLAQDPNNTDNWYYVAAGKVQEQVSDLVEYDNEWFYVKSGKLDITFSGYADYDGGKFLVAVGRIVREAQGLVQDPNNENDWYYLADGQVVDYTGLALYDEHWFYVVNGKLDVSYVGTVEYDGATFNVVNGAVIG